MKIKIVKWIQKIYVAKVSINENKEIIYYWWLVSMRKSLHSRTCEEYI